MSIARSASSLQLARETRERFVLATEGAIVPLARAVRDRLTQLASEVGSARAMQEHRDDFVAFQGNASQWVSLAQTGWRKALGESGPSGFHSSTSHTQMLRLELIGDDYTLQPDTLNLVDAASQLIRDGFKVLPYCTEDLVLCQRLVDVGCQAVMPWAAPIGTGRGPVNPYALQVLRDRLEVPMLVDAGLGLPSHACQVMEWGFDGVLLNTAVALAQDPVAMAGAFADAVQAGRAARRAGAMAAQDAAQASTPVLGTPFWHHAG